MAEHLLCAVVRNANATLARICLELAHRGVDVESMHVHRQAGGQLAYVHLALSAQRGADIDLVIRRLSRIIDVHRIVNLGRESVHERSAVFVKLDPRELSVSRITDVARLFRAEVVEVSPTAITLFHAGRPEACRELVDALGPVGLLEEIEFPTVAVRGGPRLLAANAVGASRSSHRQKHSARKDPRDHTHTLDGARAER